MESSKAMSRLLFRSAVLMDAVIALAPRIRILLKALRVVLFNPDSMPAQCSFMDFVLCSLGFRAWIGETRKLIPSSWDAGGKPLRALHLTDA